jgi:hypothetical protein
MRAKIVGCLSFAIGSLAVLCLGVNARDSLEGPYGDNIFCWWSDIQYNANSNSVTRSLARLSGTGGIKVNTQYTGGTRFTIGHYEVTIDGSGIAPAGMSATKVDHDFNAVPGTAYFVSKSATCTFPSAVDAVGKEILVCHASPNGDSITYNTVAGQLISGKASGALSNTAAYKLDRFISDGSNWYKE